MLNHIILLSSAEESIIEFITLVAFSIELIAVVFIGLRLLFSYFNFLFSRFKSIPEADRYRDFRHELARSLLLGLEMLIAADIVRTVALEASVESVLVLGLLVLIRTFLSWSLVVEIEGRWPWQKKKD